MLGDRPLKIIEEIQRCHIKAALCIPTWICMYFQAGGVCLSVIWVCSMRGGSLLREVRGDAGEPVN